MRVSSQLGVRELNGFYSAEHKVSFPVTFFLSSFVVIIASKVIVSVTLLHYLNKDFYGLIMLLIYKYFYFKCHRELCLRSL
jgi:hypothetical protein